MDKTLMHLPECEPEKSPQWQETTYLAAVESGATLCDQVAYMDGELYPDETVWVQLPRPDPRLAASWCQEGVAHDHAACGNRWNSADPDDAEQAARWASDHPSGRAQRTRDALDSEFGKGRPPIVVLCGSTKFYTQFQAANYRLTMAGAIVLSVGFYPHATAEHGHGEGVGHDSAEKVVLDELHKRKIDLADQVHVLNVGGYIGESTRSEIDYAVAAGKSVTYLEND